MQHITKFHSVPEGHLAYEISGEGPAIVFLPGWPFNRHTYRKLIPALEAEFTCINIDTLGLGESKWENQADFSIAGHVRHVKSLLSSLKVNHYSLLAFDSGGAIARALAAEEGDKVLNLILLNTDIPGKRPPWLPIYRLMFSGTIGRRLLNLSFVKKYVVPSNLMLGLAFKDMRLVDREFRHLFVNPMLSQAACFDGLGRYMRGFDYKEVDLFTRENGVHQSIRAQVHLIWGEDDTVFPLKDARKMANTLPTLTGLHAIPDAKLLVHEEQPERVLAVIRRCLYDRQSIKLPDSQFCLA